MCAVSSHAYQTYITPVTILTRESSAMPAADRNAACFTTSIWTAWSSCLEPPCSRSARLSSAVSGGGWGVQVAFHHVACTHQLAAAAEHPGSCGQVPGSLPVSAKLGAPPCLPGSHMLHHPAVLLPPRCAGVPAGLPHAALPLSVQVIATHTKPFHCVMSSLSLRMRLHWQFACCCHCMLGSTILTVHFDKVAVPCAFIQRHASKHREW